MNNLHTFRECSVDCINEICCIRNVTEACNSYSCLYSDTLRDDLGGTWRLQVFPGGNGDVKGIFACIFLELVEGIPNVYVNSNSLNVFPLLITSYYPRTGTNSP